MRSGFRNGVRAMALLCGGLGMAHAAPRLPHVLSSHMVLERDAPMHVWGWAEPGEVVTAAMDGEQARGTTDALGHWSLYLAPHAAGGPYTLTVRASSGSVTLEDVLVGDVWVASGQSNMEMPLKGFSAANRVKDGETTAAAAHDSKLRLLLIRHRSSTAVESDAEDSWTETTPETALTFSAVAYFFARELRGRGDVPIGIVDTTWGGTPIESWISPQGLTRNARYADVMQASARFLEGEADRDVRLTLEHRQDAEAQAKGQPLPKHPYHPDLASWQPSGLYNAMIAPLTPMTVRGFLWYQGESNSVLSRAANYGSLMETLVRDWREQWGGGQMPFLWAQISSFRSGPNEAWGVLRDQQRRALATAHTGMAVTLDVGTPADVHPPDKETVGHRLALLARAESYGERLVASGPLFERATIEDGSVRAWFAVDTADGLRCADRCAGFEIAGADHRFVPAEAAVEGRSVRVHAAAVREPLYVRYAWPNAPPISLSNGAGLPASTFTSERSVGEPALLPTSFGQIE